VTLISEVTPQLFIGKAKLASNPDVLHEHGITSAVKLFDSLPDWPSGFRLLDAPIDDGVFLASEKFDQFDQFIASEIEAGQKVAVVCGASISRSATVVLSYLVYSGMPLHDAFVLLRSKHTYIEPHPQLWLSLIAHHKLSYTLSDVLSWRDTGRSVHSA
jgi:protein-tyrosine phosphatase